MDWVLVAESFCVKIKRRRKKNVKCEYGMVGWVFVCYLHYDCLRVYELMFGGWKWQTRVEMIALFGSWSYIGFTFCVDRSSVFVCFVRPSGNGMLLPRFPFTFVKFEKGVALRIQHYWIDLAHTIEKLMLLFGMEEGTRARTRVNVHTFLW